MILQSDDHEDLETNRENLGKLITKFDKHEM